MKILVYSHTESFYGAPKAVFELTNMLRKKGVDVSYILPNRGKFEDNLLREHYEYYILPNPQWIVSERKAEYSLWYYFKHIVKELWIFIVSMCNAYREHIKFVQKIKPDIIFVNTSVAPLGLYVAKRLSIKSILWIHETLWNREGWFIPTLLPKRFVGRVFKKTDIIMGPSQYLKQYVAKTFGVKKMQVLPNIVDYVPTKHESSYTYTFGMVGSIAERKGQLLFLDTMIKKMPDAILIIYGTGTNDYAKKLFEVAASYPDNVKIYGYESDLDVIYSSFDIYINMGVDETFGRTTVEAMRAEKLVFGRRSGATPEIIRDGENGFLFDDADEIFEVLRKYDSEKGRKELQIIRKRAFETSLAYTSDEIIKKCVFL